MVWTIQPDGSEKFISRRKGTREGWVQTGEGTYEYQRNIPVDTSSTDDNWRLPDFDARNLREGSTVGNYADTRGGFYQQSRDNQGGPVYWYYSAPEGGVGTPTQRWTTEALKSIPTLSHYGEGTVSHSSGDGGILGVLNKVSDVIGKLDTGLLPLATSAFLGGAIGGGWADAGVGSSAGTWDPSYGYGMGTPTDYGSIDAFGGTAGGNWNYDYGAGASNYFNNVDNSLGRLFSDNYSQGAKEFVNDWWSNPNLSPSNISDTTNMNQGIGQFPTSGTNIPTAGDGVTTAALDTSQSSALSGQSTDPLSQYNFSPDNTVTDVPTTPSTVQTPNNLENITSGQQDMGGTAQMTAGSGTKPYGTGYDYSNKDFFTGKNGTGYNIDTSKIDMYKPDLANAGAAQPFKQGLEMNNLPDMWKKANTPIGGRLSNGVPQTTPLGLTSRGLGAIYDVYQGKKAEDANKRLAERDNQNLEKAVQFADQNAARGQTANNLWTQNFQDPMADYNNFMAGAGRQFTDQARAKMAQGGNRRQLGGKLQSDLASMYLTHQNQRGDSLARGFAQNNPYNFNVGHEKSNSNYIDSMKNRYAPLSQFATYASNYDLSNLWS